MLHCWWKHRIDRDGNSKRYYDWIEGRRNKPNFKDVVKTTMESLEISRNRMSIEKIGCTYDRLCSYVHAPILAESITVIEQGNIGLNDRVLRHWLELARDTLVIALEYLVHLHPQCVFAVDVIKKFGFNPPVNMYFDRYNIVPLEATYGLDQMCAFRSRFQENEFVQNVMDFYESQPDLTHEQILASCTDEEASKHSVDGPEDVVELWFCDKIKMRATSMMLSYVDPLAPNW